MVGIALLAPSAAFATAANGGNGGAAVPDGGSSIALVGAAVAGCLLVARRYMKK